jgi:hypothetical protein
MNYVAVIRGKDGMITYPFARKIDDLVVLGNKTQYVLDIDKINIDELDSHIVKDVSEGNLIIKAVVNNHTAQDAELDVTNSRYHVKLFDLSTKLMMNNDNNFNIFHLKTERTQRLSEVVNDLDAIKSYGIPILNEIEEGFIMTKDPIIDKPIEKLYHGLQVLAAIHKRGVILGHSNLLNGKIDVMSAKFYAGTDNISSLYPFIGSKMIIEKYNNDTLKIFKLATVVDVGSLCHVLDPDWVINKDIIEYINGDLKNWLADIILQKCKDKYKIEITTKT